MEITDRAIDFANEASDKIAKASNNAGKAIGKKSAQIKDAEQRLMDQSCSYVGENPMTSMGIAVAAGFLISRMLSAR